MREHRGGTDRGKRERTTKRKDRGKDKGKR
jgi:hypothetical protein